MNTGLKNITMFAVHSILKGGLTRQITAGFFYACTDYIYGFVPPCDGLMASLPFRWNATGKAEPFFISVRQTNQSVMHSTENICSGGYPVPDRTTSGTRHVPSGRIGQLLHEIGYLCSMNVQRILFADHSYYQSITPKINL